MRNLFLMVLITFFLSEPYHLKAQWAASTGLDGGLCSATVLVDSTLFVTAADNGVFFRKVDAAEWNQALSPAGFIDIFVAGEAIFAWGHSNLCFRTFDNGLTWVNMDSLLGIGGLYSLIPADSILFFSDYQNVYRSDDYGNSKYPISNSLPSLEYPVVYYSNGTLFCSESYPSLRLFKSADLGNSWDSVSLGGLPPSAWEAFCIYQDTDRIWFSGTSGLYYYSYAQETWVLFSDTLFLRNIEEINGTLYAFSGEEGFLRFDRPTQSWLTENSGLETFEVTGICSLDSTLYISTDIGPYRCIEPYVWEPFYDHMNGLRVTLPDDQRGRLWVWSGKHFYVSDDNGQSFTKEDWNLNGMRAWIQTDSCIYAIAGDTFYISCDQGNSWTKKIDGLPYTTQYPFLHLQNIAINNDFIFLGTNYGLFRATFSSYDWERLSSVYANGHTEMNLVLIDSLIFLSKRVLTNNYYYYNFRSESNGDLFDSLTLFPPFYFTQFMPDIELLYGAYFNILYRSADNGISWEELPIPDNTQRLSVSADEPYIVLSGTYFDQSLFVMYPTLSLSDDQGDSWTSIWENLPVTDPLNIAGTSIIDSRLFASVPFHGLYYRDDLLTGVNSTLEDSSLALNLFPNPSTGFCQIKLPDCKYGFYELSVFTMTGELIYTKSLHLQFSGTLSATMNLSELPVGVYLVSVSSETGIARQKMVISK